LWLAIIARIGIFAFVVWLFFVKIVAGSWGFATDIGAHRGYSLGLTVTCWATIGLFILNLKLRGPKIPAGQRTIAWILSAFIALPMYYISLTAFAVSLFPYIPATRGGGDYTVYRKVTISLKTADTTESVSQSPECAQAVGGISPKRARVARETSQKRTQVSGGKSVIRGIVVEETSTAVYVADENWKPECSRRDPWIIPELRAISRDQIARIDYPGRTTPQPPVPQAKK
jgi:hypothetical protein